MFSCIKFNTFIAVFRAGEQGRFWYAVLGGSLEVRYHAPDTENKVREKHIPNKLYDTKLSIFI